MDNSEMSDFDPYQWLVETSYFIDELGAKHNTLVNDYKVLKRRVRTLEIQLKELQTIVIAKDYK